MSTPDELQAGGSPASIRLHGRSALVTGAGRGIGACIARHLAAAGAAVWVSDKDAVTARATAAALGAQALQLDVRRPDDFVHAAAQIRSAHGRLDVLVNNAGVLTAGAFDATVPSDWDELLAVNLTGIYHAVQALVPLMQTGAAILNVASVSGQRGGGAVGNVWYGATKAALIALTSGLARELGPRGIRVNAVAPGVVDTEMTHALLTPEVHARALARFPLGRITTTDDVARMAVLLCSDAAAFVSGATLPVDGGFLCT